MSSLLRAVCLGAIAAIALTSAVAAESIQERRTATMKENWKNFKPITLVAKGKAEYSKELIGNARALEQLSKSLTIMFPEGSAGPESRAKPEIWTDPDGFEKARAAFQVAAANLVPAVESGDKGKIGAAVGAVGKACGSCHKAYRKPKKK